MIDEFIERKIVIGLIVSTDYLKQIRPIFLLRLLESGTAKRIASWCLNYYDKYNHAPKKDIEGIFYEHLSKGLPQDIAKDIEENILPGLSSEYIDEWEGDSSVAFLIQQTTDYLQTRYIEEQNEKIEALLESGEIEEAQKLMINFKPLLAEKEDFVVFSENSLLQKVESAFSLMQDPLIYYPKQLGLFWNHQFIPGGFVALLASEKRGKTFFMMDMCIRASRQGRKVVFFQAGDMTESQQLRRFCIHLARTSDMPQYCGKMTEPVVDCIFNQTDTCDRKERECGFGIFPSKTQKDIRGLSHDELMEAYKDNPEYKACHNCTDFCTNRWGVPWLREVFVKGPLEVHKAKKLVNQHFIQKKRKIILSSHPNGTLTISRMKALLNLWEKLYEFVPDIIIVDYADLLVPEGRMEFRHQQNQIWKELRNLSQEHRGGKQPLVITATQADAKSYDRDLLQLKNFSEDKRKYAHCTAMYGLNQDPLGREKKLGILRLNELVVREADFNNENIVYVLQNLKRGQPFIGSFF